MRKLIVICLLLAGCFTGENEARDAVDNAGFHDIQVGDLTYFGCSRGDKYGREFRAVNANGRRISGVVCCGVTKACTVRF